MPAFTAREAKACCTCRHYHPTHEGKGHCKNPAMRVGIQYSTGELVEWWTVGCYATCPQYSALTP